MMLVLCCRLHENYELLKGRLMNITESKSQLEVDIKRKTQHNRHLISEMNSLKPEIKRLTRQRDQLKKYVQQTCHTAWYIRHIGLKIAK